MIGIEEKIYANAFSIRLAALARERAEGRLEEFRVIAQGHACWQVHVFRRGGEPTPEEAEAMYREVFGTVDSERLSIQKECLREVLRQLGAAAYAYEHGDNDAFCYNEQAAKTLRYAMRPFERALGEDKMLHPASAQDAVVDTILVQIEARAARFDSLAAEIADDDGLTYVSQSKAIAGAFRVFADDIRKLKSDAAR